MNQIQKQSAHTILGHPDSLFVLFFTEMWERFSYYGMRALIVLFLTSTIAKGGWEWTRAEATSLYGWLYRPGLSDPHTWWLYSRQNPR